MTSTHEEKSRLIKIVRQLKELPSFSVIILIALLAFAIEIVRAIVENLRTSTSTDDPANSHSA